MTSTVYERTAVLDGHPEVRYWTKGGPVDSEMLVRDEIDVIEERQEASIGAPAAMALFGFAVGTFIVAYPIAGFVPATTAVATIPPVLLFAGIAQFIGGLIAYRRNNAFAGTAFCAYGANNAVVATFFLLQLTGGLPALAGSPAMKMLALEMYCFALISLVLAVAAVRLNLMFTLLLLALIPGFALPGIVNWFGASVNPFLGHLGGYFLIASAAIAAYSAAAMVINSTWKIGMLPLVALHSRAKRDEVPTSRGVRRAVPAGGAPARPAPAPGRPVRPADGTRPAGAAPQPGRRPAGAHDAPLPPRPSRRERGESYGDTGGYQDPGVGDASLGEPGPRGRGYEDPGYRGTRRGGAGYDEPGLDEPGFDQPRYDDPGYGDTGRGGPGNA